MYKNNYVISINKEKPDYTKKPPENSGGFKDRFFIIFFSLNYDSKADYACSAIR